MSDITLAKVKKMMLDNGVTSLYLKRLAPNDNSKNQIYLGGSLDSVNVIPCGDITSVKSSSRKKGDHRHIYKASLSFFWLGERGTISKAPGAQLIVYPQYPEVRFSGFLQGCESAPSELMNPELKGREEGRILFLGVKSDGSIVGYVAGGETPVARKIHETEPPHATLERLQLEEDNLPDHRTQLLQTLCRIHEKGWIKGKRLTGDNSVIPCNDRNCGGYTLEAELGIMPNALSKPDFLGWEIKQYNRPSFESSAQKEITMMTPEPSGGIYKEIGIVEFVRRYGYKDRKGRPDRMNVGGRHRVNAGPHHLTHLSLEMRGYDEDKGAFSPDGGVVLADRQGEEAAIWHYEKLLNHWKEKHALAAFIPSLKRNCEDGSREYFYGVNVGLGVGADFSKFLSALFNGAIFYDPGIKLENCSSDSPKSKTRSQFRTMSGQLKHLYESFEEVNVCSK